MITTTTSTAGSPTTSATSPTSGMPGRRVASSRRRSAVARAHRPELCEPASDESIELPEVGAEHVAGTHKTHDRALSFHNAERLQ